MESFFVIVLPKGVKHIRNQFGVNCYEGDSDISLLQFNKLMEKIPYCTAIDEPESQEYQFGGKYLIKPNCIDDSVKSINIEACLWYLENDELQLNKLISFFLESGLQVFHPATGYLENDIDKFIFELKLFYKNKLEIFLIKYKTLFSKTDVLPGKYFYKILGS